MVKGISEDTQKKVVSFVSENWKDWKDKRLVREEVWESCYRRYQGEIEDDGDTWPWQCKVSRPVTQYTVDSITSALKNALFPLNESYFTVRGLDEQGETHIKTAEKRLKQILKNGLFMSRMDMFVKQLVMIGNASGHVVWHQKETNSFRWVNGRKTRKKRNIAAFPRVEVEDLFEVVYDPMAAQYERGTIKIRREIVSLNQLERMKKSKGLTDFDNLDDINAANDGSSVPAERTDNDKDARLAVFGLDKQQATDLRKKGQVELLIATGDFEIDNEFFEEHLIVVANRKTLIFFGENPVWHGDTGFFASYANVFPREPLGRGAAEPIRGLQDLIDTFTCQKADIINVTMGGAWAVGRNSLVDSSNIIGSPFSIIEMEDINDIKSLVPSANPTLGFNEIADLRNEAERSSGASKFVLGQVAPGERTATEISQISAGSSNRFNDLIIGVGDKAIEPLLNSILQMDIQLNHLEDNLPAEYFEGDYSVEFNGARNSAIRNTELQNHLQFQSVLASNPIFAQFMNPEKMLKETARLLNLKNADELVRPRPIGQTFPDLAIGAQGANSRQTPRRGV